METKERNPKRPAQKRPASAARTAPQKKKTAAKAPVKKNAAKRSGSDRARREAAARAARIKNMKQQAQARPKRRVSKPRMPMQPIVYTQPKVFSRNRLIVQLASVVAVVLAVVLCLSIFFRVETITVTGANAYSAWDIREASGIEEGDYLLTFGRARACAKIKTLPYVDTVRIGIKLPDTVNIIIEEIDVVYSIQDQDGIWWLMTSQGKIMEMTDAIGASDYTKVLGVKLKDPQKDKQAEAYQELIDQPQATEEALLPGETQAPRPLVVTEQQKLMAALDILQTLELNEIVGEAASVDVADLSRIELWYGTRYQVNLGENANMDYKIACLKGAVSKLSDYDSGELDISFTTWPDKVAYTPFE